MGKLGGRELNFSSDIDLIFAYAEGGVTEGGRQQLDNQSYFTRLGQMVIRLLDAVTEDGFAFRVDMPSALRRQRCAGRCFQCS